VDGMAVIDTPRGAGLSWNEEAVAHFSADN
jgi:hypothetical protein